MNFEKKIRAYNNNCKLSYDIAKPYIDSFRTAIDIGCKVGHYTVNLVNDFEDIRCFEPRPQWISLFWKTLGESKSSALLGCDDNKRNIRIKNIHHHDYALGDVEKNVKMFGGVITQERRSRPNESGMYTILKVRQRLLDSFSFKDVDFIKIDVEGHETKVLQGGIKTITNYRPLIVLEQNEVVEEFYKGRKFDAINFLLGLGYEQVAFDGKQDYVMKYKD